MSSRILSRPGRDWSAVADIIMMGMSSALNLNMVGTEAPSGSTELTISSLSRTSLVASSMSIPYSNCRVSIEMFSLEREVSSLRLATPLREFSRVLVRFCSMSEALAPG